MTVDTMEGSRVDVAKYLDILRDPLDRGRLRLEGGVLIGESSGHPYPFVGPFPDLRLSSDATRLVDGDPATGRRVRDHYDSRPCHNYLALDNLPLGRWLRDPRYDYLFDDVETAVEVGSGKGAVALAFKSHRRITPLCIDVAYGSLRHVRAAPLNADGVLGSNLRLPIADQAVDLVISHGVTHHTTDPLRCFAELVRILRPGGRLFYAVYNWDNLYRALYFFLSPPLQGVRRALGPFGDAALKCTVFIPYHVALWGTLGLVQGRWRFPDLQDSWEQFGDFFLTPIARFYHAGELRSLADVFNLRVLEQDTGGWPGNSFSHFVWYQKPGGSYAPHRAPA